MDIVTYEIIRSSLFAVAREMKIAMMRTAGSPLMHASGDSSAAIFDADMQLVAQGNDIPTMLGSAVISTRVSVEAVGRENLRPGDVKPVTGWDPIPDPRAETSRASIGRSRRGSRDRRRSAA